MTAHGRELGRKGREARRKVAGKMGYCFPSIFGTPVTHLDSLWENPEWPFLEPCRIVL